MIKLEAAHIEEVRGIRKLDLDLRKEKFAISGPNGSGKSGVIDAIEFGLTGRIGRLTGRGTHGLSIAEHGPHVDRTKFPDAAFVTLKVFLTDLGKSATITRKVSAPKKPKIEPPDAEIKAAFDEIADHPEITLSRREILRFILVEPTKRSEEIQAILKLDDIGQVRAALNSAQNKLQAAHKIAVAQAEAARNALQLHLQIHALKTNDVLEAANKRRAILDLSSLDSLQEDTKLDDGLSGLVAASDFNKESALRDIRSVSTTAQSAVESTKAEGAVIVGDIEKLEESPALLAALQQQEFIEKGLSMIDGPDCPLCGTTWEDEQKLRQHLKAKLEHSAAARRLSESLVSNAGVFARNATLLLGSLGPLHKIASSQGEPAIASSINAWKTELETAKQTLQVVATIVGAKERFTAGWFQVPPELPQWIETLTTKVKAKPDQTAAVEAQTFLSTAQLRLNDYRSAMRQSKAAEASWSSAKTAYDSYCEVLETELNGLYDEVQKDFSTFYRALNEDDEGAFTAKLTPSEGSLGLDVNFYERGLFPPAAYHSEGHQDSMGVCLYLALMRRLLGKRFTFSLLDDVVMSVDSGHRYQFCKLLKASFPDTQFIITTHDRLWAEQMKSAGLVSGKTSIAFHSWTVDSGPLVESTSDIWQEIESALSRGKVEPAAAALRRHLEYFSRHLANDIGATPQFRSDGNYELGELLPSVLSRMKDLCGKAANAAQSWGRTDDKEAAAQRKQLLSTSNAAINVEQWAVNKAVHYNEWANFGKKDFEPVVAAFKELLGCFTCDACGSWLYLSPRGIPESLRCPCSKTNLNLKSKPKE